MEEKKVLTPDEKTQTVFGMFIAIPLLLMWASVVKELIVSLFGLDKK